MRTDRSGSRANGSPHSPVQKETLRSAAELLASKSNNRDGNGCRFCLPEECCCNERRLAVTRQIYSIWTNGGTDPSGIASKILDGHTVDLLGDYAMNNLVDSHRYSGSSRDEADDSITNARIDTLHCSTLSYDQFFAIYMTPNRPVMIQGLVKEKNWGSFRKWTKEQVKDQNRVPDLDRLSELFGTDVVPVHVQSPEGLHTTATARRLPRDMTVAEYADWWRQHHDQSKGVEELLYLKDWKFVAMHPLLHDVYYVWPEYFLDDWLNQAMGHAYKFVYLGPKGTSTRLHADVLRSYSWSSNVCGQKRWYLVPPQYTHLLYDCFGQALAPHLYADDNLEWFYPGLARARQYAIKVIQKTGDTIFVPSGWHHTVENLEPTLSINHNLLNGTNIRWSWQKLSSEIGQFKESLSTPDSLRREADTDVYRVPDDDDSSQISDDLHLLWSVISEKARECISNLRHQKHSLMSSYSLMALLPVLKGIEELTIERDKDIFRLQETYGTDIRELSVEVSEACQIADINF